ncbi:ABC-type multidrug transport system permease subunit [Bradyrhizobium sp. JR7.2]|jgi:hypothetical protein|uniref:Uncharacterized protein n=2 Tax=Bradyrhizobium TaxID=374 RepID=A0ABY3QLD3_9BRAD|nr:MULTISPECIES: hypothetical protein [Bradyrhizobium]UFW86692.1 hypothetical protein BjapCC829_43610 [Bradyrhizobium japonicum]WFT95179.1 hypothetical protein QA633_44240 [Bradyrhizobium barranii]CUU22211.1 hypothetical protein CDS [Bradyrhizobium sp.]
MKLFSQIMLIVVGLGVIYFGCNLLFQHETNEFAFQKNLLATFQTEYHWRSIGVAYGGIATVIVGAAMMAVAAIVARLG